MMIRYEHTWHLPYICLDAFKTVLDKNQLSVMWLKNLWQLMRTGTMRRESLL